MDLVTVLKNAQSPDHTVRTQAEAYLNEAVEAQYGPFVLALCVEFATEGKPNDTRQLAGLYLKNLISAKDDSILQTKLDKWHNCDKSNKEQIRAGFLQALCSSVAVVRHTSAQILGAFGAADVPNKEWPALVSTLVNYVLSSEAQAGIKVASLEALGYMCDAMDPDQVDSSVVNQMLGAIVDGLKSTRSDDIRLAAITALNNSLDFTAHNFSVEAERDAIMMTICDATQSSEEKVRERAFECLAKVADLYYEKLQRYVDAIFQLTTTAIRTDGELVGLQAIDFWTTVCDCEMAVLDDIEDGSAEDGDYLRIAIQAAPTLVPILLEAMTKQAEEDDGDDSWNIAMAATTCLDAMARTIRDNVVELVLPFVTSNIQNSNWRFKEASIMAFGSILDGPSDAKMTPIVSQAMPVLIGCLSDKTSMVRDTAAWTIGKICELHKNAISAEMLPQMVDGLAKTLEDPSAKVASQSCFAIHNLAEACGNENEAPTNVLSHFMAVMLTKLFTVASRPDWNTENLRVSAYEAVNMMVTNSALDMKPVVVQVLVETLSRLEQTMQPSYNPHERSDVQSLLCSLIGCCVQKLEVQDFSSHCDRSMQLLLQVFNTKGAAAHEDAFMAIGYIADKISGEFLRYMPYVKVPLLAGLRNVEEYQVCTVSVGLVGDTCRALGPQVAPYCDDIMHCLIELLQSPVLNKSVKPHVISSFADIAMAVEGGFERYCGVILGMLKQAGEVVIDTNDEDIIDYINSLHVAILEAYSGIIQGLKAANKQDHILSALETMADFLRRIGGNNSKSDEVLKAAVGLIGDLGQTFGQRMVPFYREPIVNELIQEALGTDDMKTTASWAQATISAIMRGKQ